MQAIHPPFILRRMEQPLVLGLTYQHKTIDSPCPVHSVARTQAMPLRTKGNIRTHLAAQQCKQLRAGSCGVFLPRSCSGWEPWGDARGSLCQGTYVLSGCRGSVVPEQQLSAGLSSVSCSRKSIQVTDKQREHKGRGKRDAHSGCCSVCKHQVHSFIL